MGMKVLAFGVGVFLLAVLAAGLVAGCGGGAPAAPTSAYTPVPGATAAAAAPLGRVVPPYYPELYPKFLSPSDTAPCHESGYCAMFAVGGGLLAAAWLDDRRMYLGDHEGRIRLLDVESGEVDVIVEGLSWPRGLTVLDGRLYVSEIGNTCELLQELSGRDDTDGCFMVPRLSRDMEFLSRVNARIISYGIGESGVLKDRRVVVDKIIAVDYGHAANGLANDGEYVYVSIGHPQFRLNPQGFFVVNADEIASYGRRADLMGVIARFRPSARDGDGAELEVYASGFRNVYGISVGPDGVIYAADNDEHGELRAGGHFEELNAVVEGGFYGYPLYGTNAAPAEANVIEPVAELQGAGSSYAYANGDGVYVGYIYIGDKESGLVVDRFDYGDWRPQRVFNSDGHTTAILERQGLLYIVSYLGNIHVINPYAAPVKIWPTGPFHNDDYVNEVIAKSVPLVISSGYDVYIDDGRLIYRKQPCAPADMEPRFYAHIFPVNSEDLPDDRKQYGFGNLDFYFLHKGSALPMGWQSGDTCWAVRELPEYPIAKILTGQYILQDTGYKHLWEVEYDFPR